MENENLNFKSIEIGNQETMRVTRAHKVFSKTNLKYFSHDYTAETYSSLTPDLYSHIYNHGTCSKISFLYGF